MATEKKSTAAKTPKKNTTKTGKAAAVKKTKTTQQPAAITETAETPAAPNTKKIGSFAGKVLNLTQIGAKKLENYAAKSAEENNNDNAKKLAAVMNKFSQKLENNQEQYIDEVEKNAEELIKIGKNTFGKMKKIYHEMKVRAETAKQKAEQDVKIHPADDKTDTDQA